MASSLQRALRLFSSLKDIITNSFYDRFSKECWAVSVVGESSIRQQKVNNLDLKKLLQDSMLWAVPKKRRSVEKRRCRRFGWPTQFYKMLVPKTNILICAKCGSYHEAGVLCNTCYNKVKCVTQEMQEAIQKELGISPVESEVVVLYDYEKPLDAEFFEGKRIVEMKKPPPKLFSDNLLQKSTETSKSKEVVIQSKSIA